MKNIEVCSGSNKELTKNGNCISCGSNAGNIVGKAFPHSVPKNEKPKTKDSK